MEKIGNVNFIITTFLRDQLLYKSVQSLINNYFDGMIITIIDQGNPSDEKTTWLNSLPSYCHYHTIPFNSGLSIGRNIGVKLSKELNCEYTFIASDSFLFNESIKKIPDILKQKLFNYNLIGFELISSVCGWEATLSLIEGKHFELIFIDKSIQPENNIYNVDICRNIFIATTESLLQTKWDENLLLGEHESFFWEYKQKGFKCGWTNYIYCNKMTDRPQEYTQFRRINFNEGLTTLRKKYQIANWVEYKNLDRAKNYQKYSNLDNSI
jgi:hypothetical protein